MEQRFGSESWREIARMHGSDHLPAAYAVGILSGISLLGWAIIALAVRVTFF